MDESKINETLKLYLDSNLNKAEVGKAINLSRERVGQILRHVNGKRDPLVHLTSKIDWEALRELCRVLSITQYQIAHKVHCHHSTVSHVLMGEFLYTIDGKSKATKAALIARGILEIIQDRYEQASLLYDRLDENIIDLLEQC